MSGYILRTVAMSLLPTAWGCDEVAPDETTRTLCECGHTSEADAIACASQRATPELGRLGYEAYKVSTGGKTFDGRDMPTFDQIRERTPHVARAWEAAATAIRKAVKP